MNFLRDIRLMPVVICAILALSVLKVTGLLLDGGYILSDPRFGDSKQVSWAQDMLNYPNGRPNADTSDVTGSVAAKPKEEAKPETKPAAPPPPPQGQVIVPEENKGISASERAVLERLQSRRQELEARARELEIRENLMKASEKKIQAKADEVKTLEAKIGEGDEKKKEQEAAQLKSLIIMYENMKPKDAAKIFDRLDMKILYDVATKVNPRKMADILAQMSTEAAERLTVEIATRAGAGGQVASYADLPKIEGQPAAKK